MIKARIEAAEKSDFAAGNTTEKLVAFKTTKDISRGDPVCTGLCFVSGACESVALCCSIVKCISFRGPIHVSAKVISKGCMAFHNACAAESC